MKLIKGDGANNDHIDNLVEEPAVSATYSATELDELFSFNDDPEFLEECEQGEAQLLQAVLDGACPREAASSRDAFRDDSVSGPRSSRYSPTQRSELRTSLRAEYRSLVAAAERPEMSLACAASNPNQAGQGLIGPGENVSDHDLDTRASYFIATDPLYSFESLVLPGPVMEKILLAVDMVELETLVFDTWSLRRIQPRPSVAIGLYGSTGTGKTLAAHAIASRLGRKILCSKHSQLESKYYGEGPKNLDALFYAAETQNAVLFLDEADSLMSRRLENVSHWPEQSVNTMRSALLMCLDRFEGVVIFATNSMRSCDRAFDGRVRHIEIPDPNFDTRREIWRRLLPAELPVAEGLSLDDLAAIEEINGGEIRQAVIDAAARVARERRHEVTQQDLLTAIDEVKRARLTSNNSKPTLDVVTALTTRLQAASLTAPRAEAVAVAVAVAVEILTTLATDPSGATRLAAGSRWYGIDVDSRRVAGPLSVLGRTAPPVSIQTLGAFKVTRDGVPIPNTAWQSKKARDLLKILVARRRSTPREQLMEMLWPGVGPTVAGNRLSIVLSMVRDVLQPQPDGEAPLAATDGAVSLNPTQVRVDVEEFLAQADAAFDACRAGEPDATAQLIAAVAAHSCDFLENDLYQEWATTLAEEVRATHMALLRALIARLRDCGATDDAVRYAFRLLERDHYDEEAYRTLIGVLFDAGCLGEARRHYESYARRMAEIDVQPNPFSEMASQRGRNRMQPEEAASLTTGVIPSR